MELFALLAVFSPLLGFLASGLFVHKLTPAKAQLITVALMVISAFSGMYVAWAACFEKEVLYLHLAPFLDLAGKSYSWALYIDALSGLMVGVVTLVSLMVHIYSVGYMEGDESIPRFMAYLSLFTFLMLILVTAPHLLQVFVGWEGVGLASYLLIGFYYKKPSANAACIKAFLVNRVGDAGFILGMALMLYTWGNLSLLNLESLAQFSTHAIHLPLLGPVPLMEALAGLFFLGAMGKSAQLGLHVWLPDAMEGPTPVSALIHAATMVTAGVFLMVRLAPILEQAPHTQTFILIIGAITALMAATIGCVQKDIKRVIAYSTCSQLGYMFMAIGVSAYGAAMFHLTTHAFFKALLFLGAGSVIHSFSGEQNIDHMGGAYRKIPFTYAMMWIGNLALAGLPFFAGFYSKDAILSYLFSAQRSFSSFAFAAGLLGAFLTAFYSWRLLINVFHGEIRASSIVTAHLHESPWVMRIPMLLLAVGAVFSGKALFNHFLGVDPMWPSSAFPVLPLPHLSLLIESLPVLLSLGGVGLAYLFYTFFPQAPQWLTQHFSLIHKFLTHQWYVDALYEKVFVRNIHHLACFFWKKTDQKAIDHWAIHGLTRMTLWTSARLTRFQTGFIRHYALLMLMGTLFFSLFLLWTYH